MRGTRSLLRGNPCCSGGGGGGGAEAKDKFVCPKMDLPSRAISMNSTLTERSISDVGGATITITIPTTPGGEGNPNLSKGVAPAGLAAGYAVVHWAAT